MCYCIITFRSLGEYQIRAVQYEKKKNAVLNIELIKKHIDSELKFHKFYVAI